MNSFWPPTRPDAQWVSVGPLAQFPDVAADQGNLIQPRACDAKSLPGCRILVVPKSDPSQAAEIAIPAGAATSPTEGQDLKDQVVVFRYRDKMHALDHVSSHRGTRALRHAANRRSPCLSNARTICTRCPMGHRLTLRTLALYSAPVSPAQSMAGLLTCLQASRTVVFTSFLSGKSSSAMCMATHGLASSEATLPTAKPSGCGGDKKSAKRAQVYSCTHLSGQVVSTATDNLVGRLVCSPLAVHEPRCEHQVPPFDRRCFPRPDWGPFVQ